MSYPILFHVSGNDRDGLEFHLDLVCGRTSAHDTAFVFEYFQDCCESMDVASVPVYPGRYYTAEYHWDSWTSFDGEVDYQDWLENVQPHHRAHQRRNMFQIKATVKLDLVALTKHIKPHLPRKLKKKLQRQGRDWKSHWLHSRTWDEQVNYALDKGPMVDEISAGMDAACLAHMLNAAHANPVA